MGQSSGLDVRVDYLVLRNFELIIKKARRIPIPKIVVSSEDNMQMKMGEDIFPTKQFSVLGKCRFYLECSSDVVLKKSVRNDREYVLMPLATIAHNIYRIFKTSFFHADYLEIHDDGFSFDDTISWENTGDDFWYKHTVDERKITLHKDGKEIIDRATYRNLNTARNYVRAYADLPIDALAFCCLRDGLTVPIDLTGFQYEGSTPIDITLIVEPDPGEDMLINGYFGPLREKCVLDLNPTSRFGTLQNTLARLFPTLALRLFLNQGEHIQTDYARFSGVAPGILRTDGSIKEDYPGPICEQLKDVQLSRFSIDPGMKGFINDAFTRDPLPEAKLVFSYGPTDLYQPPRKKKLPRNFGKE